MDDMGTFRTTMAIENPSNRGPRHVIEGALVETGAELIWVPSRALSELGIALARGPESSCRCTREAVGRCGADAGHDDVTMRPETNTSR